MSNRNPKNGVVDWERSETRKQGNAANPVCGENLGYGTVRTPFQQVS
jgi:hypothetical protein